MQGLASPSRRQKGCLELQLATSLLLRRGLARESPRRPLRAHRQGLQLQAWRRAYRPRSALRLPGQRSKFIYSSICVLLLQTPPSLPPPLLAKGPSSSGGAAQLRMLHSGRRR